MPEVGRVLIAFDDGPLEPAPTWTRIDGAGDFPDHFVAGFDLTNGRTTLLDVTGTGEATVYVNDRSGLFDPRNSSSPYYNKLQGRQIMLQIYDPVREVWEQQFGGTILGVSYDIDGSAVNADGEPINASLQINCVDVFDYLAGFGLTPGLDGVAPAHLPAGAGNGVWYAETSGEIGDITGRIPEVLEDANIDPARYVSFTGNVAGQAVKYDPDESALTALRDAADAEFPFIANLYVDRFGRVVFHGRYGRFDPDGLAADIDDPDVWDFHRWKVGDGAAIAGDATRAQIRVLSYIDSRDGIVNVAVAYPAYMKADQMPNQVYANTASINAYGKRAAPPMTDLLISRPITDSGDRYTETLRYAELLVKNQKDPVVAISACNLKSVTPTDARASVVWAMLSQVDVSDVVNVKVGYPGGTGLTGASPADDHFVEGRHIEVRPLQGGYDYVSLDLSLSPFVWSADTHGVFPVRPT